MNLHGKVINYNQIKDLPVRNEFLEPKQKQIVDAKIQSNAPLMFMPNYLHEAHVQDQKYKPSKYKIILFGVFTDGRKASVVISGIKPYFEILLSDESPSEQADKLYIKLDQLKYAKPDNYEIHTGKEFKLYKKKNQTFMRIYFTKLKNRKEAIKIVREMGLSTSADDISCYYRVVCRDYLTTFSSWVTISNYSIRKYSCIRGTVFNISIDNYTKYEGDITKNTLLSKDNIMTCCWDIETYSDDGRLPKPDNLNHKMFMIGITFQWHHAKDQLLRVCLVDHPCKPKPNYLTVVCGNEKKLIKAFGKVFYKMKPEIVLGFNDSDYDWPWLVERGKHYPGTLAFLANCFDSTMHWKNYDDNDIFNYNYKKEKVKLEADTYAYGRTLVFPGYLNVDVRNIFRQLYPTAEKSNLNFYLALNKLGGKKDMPYVELFRIYREMDNACNIRDAQKDMLINMGMPDSYIDSILQYASQKIEEYSELMAEVADYCVIDSQRCHELMKIRSVVMDRREVANLSYTSVFDSLFRANGMKVRNLVIARGQKLNIKFSNISNQEGAIEDGKYPGAYVFPPVKGLVTSKLTIQERIDLSKTIKKYAIWETTTPEQLSKYYNIIKKYGACLDESIINEVIDKYEIGKHMIDFLLEPTGRPITGLDFSSLYPSLIMTYNLSPEYIIIDKKEARRAHDDGHELHKIKFTFNGRTIRGWSIRHGNKLDPNSEDYKFGIYPMILKELFDTRKEMKKILHKWEAEKERLETLPKETFESKEIQDEYENVCFNYNYINSKQKALKVFMNTFYGESGNKRSPFFVLQLAGAITTAGQQNIKMVQKHVEDVGSKVYYGDTDSVYSAVSDKHFDDIDRKYFTCEMTKDDYWNSLVDITFTEIKKINDDVNKMLIKDNGTKFLKIAYEEALFPVAFLAKKKYYGIPHISVPNFNAKNMFIRGLEVKKRGASEILKKVCMDIMWNSVNISNIHNLMELVQNKIHEIYKTDWDFTDFIKTDTYRPHKQNIKVQSFVARMKNIGVKIKPNERFQYVIVKRNPYRYDHRGRKVPLKTGDKMELSTRAAEQKMKIDLDYYMNGGINGQLSRLITYHESFHVEPTSLDADDLKTADDKIYKNASKYIDEYCKQYYDKYANKGKIYQKIFKVSNKVVEKKLNEYCDPKIVKLLTDNYDVENLYEWLNDKAYKQALKENKEYGREYVKHILKNLCDDERKVKIKKMQYAYYASKQKSIQFTHKNIFDDRSNAIRRQVGDNMFNIVELLKYQTDSIEDISNIVKNSLDIDNLYNKPGDIIETFDIDDEKIPTDNVESRADTYVQKLINNDKLYTSTHTMNVIYINMVCNHQFIIKTNTVVDYLKQLRNRTTNIILKPKTFDLEQFKKENIDKIISEM